MTSSPHRPRHTNRHPGWSAVASAQTGSGGEEESGPRLRGRAIEQHRYEVCDLPYRRSVERDGPGPEEGSAGGRCLRDPRRPLGGQRPRIVPPLDVGPARNWPQNAFCASETSASTRSTWKRRDGLAGTRGRTIQRVVRVRTCREIREVEPAPEVPREQRAEVWGRWLAEGRYRSRAELARAAGLSRETVSVALRGSTTT